MAVTGFALGGRSRFTALFSARVDRELLAKFCELAKAEMGHVKPTGGGTGNSAVRLVLERVMREYIASRTR